jgi:antitoxin VapB
MALNLKNPEVESLAAEVAKLAGETKTEAIRIALQERKARLAQMPPNVEAFERYLRNVWWPSLPAGLQMPSREEEDGILGYGPRGY